MPAGLYELEDIKVAIRAQDSARLDQILADRDENGTPFVLSREEDHKNLLTWFFKEINHWYARENWPLLLKLLAVRDNQDRFTIQVDHTNVDSNPLHQILSVSLVKIMHTSIREKLKEAERIFAEASEKSDEILKEARVAYQDLATNPNLPESDIRYTLVVFSETRVC